MPKILKVITDPNPKLRERSVEINLKDIETQQFKELCNDMTETMLKKDGVGLAAPQIEKNIRLITVNTKDGSICMINPKIKQKSWAKSWDQGGCLSVPDKFGEVKRHKKISFEYYDIKGEKIFDTARGFFARVIQHEIDHIDGILFTDKACDIKDVKKL